MNERTQDIIDQIQQAIGEDVVIYRMNVTDEMRAKMAQIMAEIQESE